MIYVYGVGIALAIYFGIHLLARCIHFVASGRVWNVAWQQWALSVIALCIILIAQFVFPPSKSVYVSQVLPNHQKGGPESSIHDQTYRVSDIIGSASSLSDTLRTAKFHPALEQLEVWSLIRTDQLDYKVPAHGYWHILKWLPENIRYVDMKWDDVIAESRLSCRYVFTKKKQLPIEKVCDLVAPVSFAADIVSRECRKGQSCRALEHVRFPALYIRIMPNGLSFDIPEQLKRGYGAKLSYEVLLSNEQGGQSWLALPVHRIGEQFFSTLERDIKVRVKVKSSDISMINIFEYRAHYNGKANYSASAIAAVRSHKGYVRNVRGFLALGRNFVRETGGNGKHHVFSDTSLYLALRSFVHDSLMAAGGDNICRALYSSILIHRLADYLDLNINVYRKVPENIMQPSTQEHLGLKELEKIQDRSVCVERQTALEMLATEVKSLLPEKLRHLHFDTVQKKAGEPARIDMGLF